MEYIKVRDIKKGEYYAFLYGKDDPKVNAIGISDSDKSFSCSKAIFGFISNKGFFSKGSSFWEAIYLRKATQEEIDWLNKCIEENRFIDLKDIKKDNLIINKVIL